MKTESIMVLSFLDSTPSGKKMSDSTFNNRLAAIKAFLAYASACSLEYIIRFGYPFTIPGNTAFSGLVKIKSPDDIKDKYADFVTKAYNALEKKLDEDEVPF